MSEQQKVKFSEWLQPETLAILCTAIYYGVPNQGHPRCYRQMIREEYPVQCKQVTEREPLQGMHCIECGKPLLQVQEGT